LTLVGAVVFFNIPISIVPGDVHWDGPLSNVDRSKPFPRKYIFDSIEFFAFYMFVEKTLSEF